ncbi:hypothetical protein PsYK624_043380 [Phanerochaete sordida]|uniref:Uncharacterized protein n=1 Tax=Phanerochaete sordida TaxID=48140 RepID=A0A9P3LAJ5_9APHY|nr:hypothetical protein PsYK624_043380 [Phanerochaete sordida]
MGPVKLGCPTPRGVHIPQPARRASGMSISFRVSAGRHSSSSLTARLHSNAFVALSLAHAALVLGLVQAKLTARGPNLALAAMYSSTHP